MSLRSEGGQYQQPSTSASDLSGLAMEFTPPTAEQIARARQNVDADENSIKEAKEILLSWLKTQPHLPDAIDEVRLERLYLNCKCSLERTKVALDAYFSLRSRLPELLQERDLLRPDLQAMAQHVMLFPMPRLTPEGYRVHLSLGAVSDLSKYNPDAYVKLFLMMLEVRLAEDLTPGDVYVIDCGQFTMAHIASFGPARVRKIEMCVRTAYCSRIKALHFVNMSQVVDLLYKIVVNSFSSKLAKRVHVHSKAANALLDHLPAECLPDELGGNAGPARDIWEAWQSKLLSYRDWFLKQDSVTSDETRRPGKDPYGEGLFGCEGSFRKLQLD
ncbi:alpha-tocopherol transfer protein-like [Schistocerca piceifrons]|uniref:alpha-tocopherol transfer protein-like n=1 Tax=Schistocerca piceifrons TaxID=274613 RepID=UPI001F5E7FFD|nr:alpha-tocopherol transfer protein-like [Schistocerca piceifrons]